MGKSELSIFVESLFDQQGSRLSDGAISVEMIGVPRFLVIRFYEDTNRKTVEININNINMGYFESYSGQGLKYAFHQNRRTGMNKRNLTSAEKFIENVCEFHNDEIRLFRAYS
ncbi:hypothetical protein [Phocaeicola faecicola]|uniref:hypothetical protein n=1 Tax=Phocaeicola faecicola TaxID=2739389 RepID=UPI002A813D3B|nr:hypothetical protein [Phocaeicola faecicola]MCI5742575.1 hypothetical protein [Bacteroides sp.]MDD6907886.1 hypothetical protein [Bacteroidaceae bacterium]MDY4871995.1 hypothetical protein [Phocaeicola faecicola]